MKKIIFSHGEKGGVGKSMIATLIANELAHNSDANTVLLIEGDTGIPDVAERFKHVIKTIGIPLQRSDLAVEAIGQLFSLLEEKFSEGFETVLINLPAGAAATIDKHAVDLIAPVAEAMDAEIIVTYAMGPGSESAAAAGKSLNLGLAGIADMRIAVLNSVLGAPAKMAWSRSTYRDEWFESGGIELVLPTLTARLADRLNELDGTLTQLAQGDTGDLQIIDRVVMNKFIRDSSKIVEAVL